MDQNHNPKRILTATQKMDMREKGQEIIEKQNYVCGCPGCIKRGEYLTDLSTIAHRIPKSVQNIKKLGWKILDHRFNLVATHKGDCNDGVLIGNARPEEQKQLIERIKENLEG